MRFRLLAMLVVSLLSSHALAFDATNARRYASPDMYRPNVDSIILNGPGSKGPADGFSVTMPGTGSGSSTLLDLLRNQPETPAFFYGILPSASAATNRGRLLQAIADGAKNLILGPGTYVIDNTAGPIIVDTDGVTLRGAGRTATTVQGKSLTADLIRFGTGATFRNGFTLRDLTISGPATGTMTSGTAVSTANTFALTLDRVRVLGYCNSIDTYNAQSPTFTDVYLAGACPNTGKFITARGSGTGFNMYLTRVGTDGGTGVQPAAGLYIENFDGIFATDTQFNRSGTGLDFNPPAPTSGKFPNFSHFLAKGLSLDTNSNVGLAVRGAGYVFDVKCLQCFIDTNDNSGVYVSGGNLDGFYFAHGELKSNATHGMYFAVGASNLSITDNLIAGNSRATFGSFNGIQFGTGTFTDVRIAGNRIGPGANLPDWQGYAIGVDQGGGSTFFNRSQFTGNNFAGNLSGRIAPNFLTSSFTDRTISGNAGLITETAGAATISAGSGVVTVSHGLGIAPALSDITVAPNSNLGTNGWWVDNATATTFQIHTNNAVATATPFSWTARLH